MRKPGTVTCAGPWRLLQFQLQLQLLRQLLRQLQLKAGKPCFVPSPFLAAASSLLPRIQSYQLQEQCLLDLSTIPQGLPKHKAADKETDEAKGMRLYSTYTHLYSGKCNSDVLDRLRSLKTRLSSHFISKNNRWQISATINPNFR